MSDYEEECHHHHSRQEQQQREARIRAVLDEVRTNLAMWEVARSTESGHVVEVWAERSYDPLHDLCVHDLELAIVQLLVADGEHHRLAQETFQFLRSVTT